MRLTNHDTGNGMLLADLSVPLHSSIFKHNSSIINKQLCVLYFFWKFHWNVDKILSNNIKSCFCVPIGLVLFLKYVHPSWKHVWYRLISSNVENLPIDLLKQVHICTAKRVTVAFYFLFWNCSIWKEIVQFHWNFLFAISVPSSLARFTLSDDCTLFDQ